MLVEWLMAAAVLGLFLALLPRLLRGTRRAARKSGGGTGMIVAIGIAFSMIFDPKLTQAMEQVARKNELGDRGAGESGDKPEQVASESQSDLST